MEKYDPRNDETVIDGDQDDPRNDGNGTVPAADRDEDKVPSVPPVTEDGQALASTAPVTPAETGEGQDGEPVTGSFED